MATAKRHEIQQQSLRSIDRFSITLRMIFYEQHRRVEALWIWKLHFAGSNLPRMLTPG